MKIRISCPAASMTADLTEEQVSAVFEQVTEWAFTHKKSFKEESNEDVYDSPDYSPDEDNEPSLLEVLSRDITDESTFTPPIAPKPEIKAFSSLGEVKPETLHQLSANDQGYKGLLYIRCDKCGRRQGFFKEQPTSDYYCKQCGTYTPLKDLKKIKFKCPNCENSVFYMTNIKDSRFVMNCHRCQSPVDITISDDGKQYFSMQ